ncbi:uncharacterized protein LOC111282449 isoform X2 [Durio zibethinus]|uniref:Uncharacterized protein LOC111282449 isoform X2 n=1 Tax=Durio zibethinus TaxID=66656 RepID=A0A6P5XEI3_DURZI|nr:uncharacterized protein LOC111282449 isoform X2 [Durio zibethinus]
MLASRPNCIQNTVYKFPFLILGIWKFRALDRTIVRDIRISIMADSTTDDLEPLFDYRRVQPLNFVCIDDDDSDTSPVPSQKRRKITGPDVVKVNEDEDVEVIKVVNVEEEDWLAPPPMVSTDAYSKIGEDSTIKELRLRKQELVSFAQSAKNMLLEVQESAKRELSGLLKPSLDVVAEQPNNPASERVKIVISIQNKDELKQFRVYMVDSRCHCTTSVIRIMFHGIRKCKYD